MKKQILLSLSLIGLLAGCASYNASPLQHLSYTSVDITEPTDGVGVFVAAKKLSKAECMKYFDRDVIAKGYTPIQLYIKNESAAPYVFSTSRLGLTAARAEEVAEKVHTSTVGRAVGYGAGAMVLWPLAIPAIIDGIKSAKANDALDEDFDMKVASDQIISEHSYFNKVVFVPTSAVPISFDVTLIEAKTHAPVTFNVPLQGF